jgi:hypothetical protein
MAAVLSDYVREGAASPYRDCTVWVADWVLLRTGRDPMAEWRGAYGNRFGYLRLLRRQGGLGVCAARGLASIGTAQIDPSAARAGDVGLITVLLPSGALDSAMGVRGQYAWLLKTTTGICRYPPICATAAWRI